MPSLPPLVQAPLTLEEGRMAAHLGWNQRADRLGALASFLCALHCASWPFLLLVLPALGASFLASELLERGFVVLATLLASVSLLNGYRVHRRRSALAVLAPALALLWFGSFGPWHHDLIPHAVLMTLGGLAIAAAHLRNMRLLVGPTARPQARSCRH